LKNSTFLEKSQNSGDPKCLEIREDRLQRILTQFHFRQSSEKEFFNSHACSQQLSSRVERHGLPLESRRHSLASGFSWLC